MQKEQIANTVKAKLVRVTEWWLRSDLSNQNHVDIYNKAIKDFRFWNRSTKWLRTKISTIFCEVDKWLKEEIKRINGGENGVIKMKYVLTNEVGE